MTLVDREDAFSLLERLVARRAQGSGESVVISGSVGVGKTELALWLARRATEAGARLLDATASRTERALAFGVIRQLFDGAELDGPTNEQVTRLLEDPALTTPPHASGLDVDEVRARAMQQLRSALLAPGSGRPTVVVVDDIQHADAPSLQVLLYLARRLRSTPMLLVVTEQITVHRANPLFLTELLRQPHCHHIRLHPLSQRGIAELLAGHVDRRTSRHLAGPVHRMTGGNPLLVRAVVEDGFAPTSATAAELPAGEDFVRGVMSCLYRCDDVCLRVARALAVLGSPNSPPLVGELARASVHEVGQATKALTAAGLLSAGGFRHPAARAAVISTMDAGESASIRYHAARALHDTGAGAAAIARHLVAADRADSDWAVPVLVEAAEQAVLEERLEAALSCLRLAERGCQDNRQRFDVVSTQMRVEWRVDPAIAARHLSKLLAADLAGQLDRRHASTVIQALLWFGRPVEAAALARRWYGPASGPYPAAGPEEPDARLWMAFAYPGIFGWPGTGPGQTRHLPGGLAPADPHPPGSAPRAVPAPLPGGPAAVPADAHPEIALAAPDGRPVDDAMVARAEKTLQQCVLDDTTLAPIAIALGVLIHTERLDRAVFWCDALSRSAGQRARTWHGVLGAVRSVISIRQGDLTRALEHARGALNRLSPRSWGVAVGLPLAVAILAAVASAQFEEAARLLSVPVPEMMYQTPFGLVYVFARGRYNHTIHRHYAALSDFRSCGELMKRWRIDVPSFLPWRSEAALTYLSLDQPEVASELVGEQLNLLGPGPSRTHGISLRVLAAASPPADRQRLLRQAVEELRGCGDQLELAIALAELSQVFHLQGDRHQARIAVRRAYHIAERCGAELLRRGLPINAAEQLPEALERTAAPHGVVDLSDAERRVAVLAAQGHTNRQIASKLYVSVSTVEQHLTRVYRKLQVTRRSDLPLVGL